ncbi:MAG: ribulose-phosphate 3-epimerase [Bacillota bacterium]
MVKLSPSILSADFLDLKQDIKVLEENKVEYLHIDVMDGHFVPNITMGPVILDSINKETDMILDVHLMIDNPSDYIEDFVNKGADILTVHYESSPHIHRLIQMIKSFDIKAGVSINPGTPVNVLEEIITEVDLVLIMSVNPGFGGQKFIESSLEKIAYIDNIRKQLDLDFKIQVDGGIKDYNVLDVANVGVDLVVAGSAIFNENGIKKNIEKFKKALDEK